VFELARVVDVMIPRAEIKSVDVATPFADLVRVFGEVTHSRLPVYRGTLDVPLGFVHIKDVVSELARHPETPRPLDELKRDALFVPPSMKLADLLVKMQARRIHLAFVVDEHGGTDGILTLEDIVEVLVGNIDDEHDELEAATYVRRTDHVWEADGRTEIAVFVQQTGVELRLSGSDAEIDTLGGVVVALAGKVPEPGERLVHPGGAEFEILEADTRRIRRLRLTLPDATPPPLE
jgi:magnesium and cobalt transporter